MSLHKVISILALKVVFNRGTTQKEAYIASLEADILSRLAIAPAFTNSTSHQKIANNINSIPVQDWQRPLNKSKIKYIGKKFSNPNELMPNPVLLSRNPLNTNNSIQINPFVIKTSSGPIIPVNNLYTITVSIPKKDSNQKPLWILDGQHRIFGIGTQSKFPKTKVPFVLLFDQVYQPGDFAKIFAQVTTEATPLDKLHQEWLQFAFDLGVYDRNTNPNDYFNHKKV